MIRDNGQGFSQAAITARIGRSAGIGLMGMTERVRMVAGEQRIESSPGNGTTIVIELPLVSRNENSATESTDVES